VRDKKNREIERVVKKELDVVDKETKKKKMEELAIINK
jgi:hypothetical protein